MNVPTDRIDALFARWDRPDSPGLAVGVIRDGELVYQRDYGMADLDHDIAIGPDTKFFIASMSKQFVAACVHLLAMDGKLSLDDDIRRHAPELPDYGQPITLRHLLCHTSGLREYTALMSLSGLRPLQDYVDNRSILRLLARQRGLNAPPGVEHAYCNSGYVLLAEVVERVSGAPLRDFCRTRIFEPLGMTDTGLDDDFTRIVKRRATSYRPAADGFHRFVKSYDVYGDAGLWSTVEDLARWDRNFYDPIVGGPELAARMLEPGRLADGTQLHYASGLAHWRYRGLDALIHGGLAMGFRSQMMRFPAQRATIICLMNVLTISTTDLCQQVADVVLADHFSEPAPVVDFGLMPAAEVLESLAGVYLDRRTGLNADVSVDDGRLWIDLFGAQAPLGPLSSASLDLSPSPSPFDKLRAGSTRGGESSPPSLAGKGVGGLGVADLSPSPSPFDKLRAGSTRGGESSPPSLAGKGVGGLGVADLSPSPSPTRGGESSPPSLAGKGAGGLGLFRILGGPMLVDLRFERADPAAAWRLHVFAEMHTLPVMTQTPVETLPLDQLREYEGRYFSDELEVAYLFEVQGQELTVGYPNQPPMPLKTGPADVFRAQSDAYCFERDAAGQVVSFLMQAPRARNIRFVREP